MRKRDTAGALARIFSIAAVLVLAAFIGREISNRNPRLISAWDAVASEIPALTEPALTGVEDGLSAEALNGESKDAMEAAAGAQSPVVDPADRVVDESRELLSPAERASVNVSEAKTKRRTGLELEALDVKTLKKLKDQAREYVDFRRGRLTSQKKAALVAACLARSQENPFCDYLVDAAKIDAKKAAVRSRRRSRADLFRLSEQLAKGDLDSVRDAREYEVFRALGLFPNWEVLQPIADRALKGSSCEAPTQLLMALGSKAEEFFPEERFRKTAIDLYTKAHRCGGPSDSSADKARFRLALLHVWDDKCALAEPVLDVLSKNPEGDYVTRSYYWMARCAEKRGDTLKVSLMRNKLQQVNPLGFHTLSLFRKDVFQIIQAVNPAEPKVRFREPGRPDLSRMIRNIEVLQSIESPGYAQVILDDLKRRLGGTSPEFQLYVSLVTERNNDNVGTFSVLADLIRDHPSFISSTTLEIVFPLERFATISQYRRKIDPYLVISLIRQESAFNVRARSSAGAVGLMQLLPSTAREMARVSRRSLLNPKVNIRVGVKYLDRLIRRFDGDTELALAAYNAGPGNVSSWLTRYPTDDRMLFLDLIPFKETRNYVALIGRNYFWYMGLYSKKGLYLSELATRKIASDEPSVLFKSLSPFH